MHSLHEIENARRNRRMNPPQLLEGLVREVDADNATVMATITRQSRTAMRGPFPYQRGIEPAPAVGDTVWIQTADSGRMIVTAWRNDG